MLRAIHWSGQLSDDAARVHSSPSDSEFKQHFEEVVSEVNFLNPDLSLTPSNVYIPMLHDSVTP